MTDVQQAVAQRIRERSAALPPPEMCRLLRKSAGLSQGDIAQACGVTQSAVALWEQGSRKPTGRRLAAYVEALRAMREAV